MRVVVLLVTLVLLASCRTGSPGAADRSASPSPSQPVTPSVAAPTAAPTATDTSPTADPTDAASAPTSDGADALDVLIFTRTEGFRHDSIPAGIAAVKQIGERRNWRVAATEDPTVFTDDGLSAYEVVVWLSTTGDVLNADQQAAFERWFRAGGGWVGIHAAADTEYDWPWYGRLLGAWFRQHPAVQEARLTVEDGTHPSTQHLGDTWVRTDEWYDFRTNPRPDVRVLLTVDENSYDGGVMGADHPIAWCHTVDGGTAWYTAGGHTEASFSEPDFVDHLAGGIASVTGDGGC